MKNLATLALGLALLTLACKPTPDPSPQPTPKPMLLDTLWSAPLGLGMPLQMNSNGDVLLSNWVDNTQTEPIFGVNGNTGALSFTWQDYINPNSQLYPGYYLLHQDHLVIADQANLLALNTLTGQTAWKMPAGAYAYGSVISSNPLGKCYQGQSKQDYLLEVFEIDVLSGNKTLVINVYDSSQQYKHIRLNLLQWGQNSQDQACLFLNLQYSNPQSPNEVYQRQLCYNLVQQKMVWEYDFNGVGGRSAYAAQKFFVVYGAEGKQYIQCFAVDNGQILWQQEIGEDPCQALWVHDSKVVAVPWGVGEVKAFEVATGAEQWRFSIMAAKYADFVFWNQSVSYHPPYLFAAYGAHLLVLNLQTGQEVYYQPIGLNSSRFYKGVAVNPETRRIYVNDIRTLRCYKLPQEVVF